MNFQQVKIVREAVRCEFNLTEVAHTLFTSQSGVSRHIRDPEEELGVEIYIRRGKRLLGMTEPGKALLVIAERILDEAGKARCLADVFTNETSGVLTVAITCTQARYRLPRVIKALRQRYPNVVWRLIRARRRRSWQCRWLAKLMWGIVSEQLANHHSLAAFPWFS